MSASPHKYQTKWHNVAIGSGVVHHRICANRRTDLHTNSCNELPKSGMCNYFQVRVRITGHVQKHVHSVGFDRNAPMLNKVCTEEG